MKQTKEPAPEIYKVIYKLSRWKTKSERYFTAFSTQEALEDFNYVFTSGHVDSFRVVLFDIIKYNRFADKWYTMLDTIKSLPEGVKRDKKGRLIFTK
jgi:hypothetical protein